MKVGLFINTQFPEGFNLAERVPEMVAQVRAAGNAGFSSLCFRSASLASMSRTGVESGRRRQERCVLMRQNHPVSTLAGRELIASAADSVAITGESRCHGASTGRLCLSQTRESGEC